MKYGPSDDEEWLSDQFRMCNLTDLMYIIEMSQKSIKLKSHKAESYDEKKITSSQHSKIKKNIAVS